MARIRVPSRGAPPPGKVETAPAADAAARGVRVAKLLAEQGVCSRREADDYIARGWVYADGVQVTELGTRVPPGTRLTLASAAERSQAARVTILLHKPVGYVSGQPEPGFVPAISLIRADSQWPAAAAPLFDARHLRGLAPAGRLDIDSTGLLVLTQDGRIARQLIGEDSGIDKEYLVRVEGRLAADGLARLRHGLSLDGRPLKPAQVEWLNDDQLRFVLREGRKRQIRRMCELVGLKVVGLKRVRIGGVKLGNLPPGQWRYLEEGEAF
jgi:23S rRNA pseudouridine2604 synthase